MSPSKTSRVSKRIPSITRTVYYFFMLLFGLLFLISFFLFLREIMEVKKVGTVHPRNPIGIIFSGSRAVSGESFDIEDIDVWMTFSYINFGLHLPDEYLRDQLSIKDPKYPNISLRGYIKKNNLDSKIFLQKLQDILRAHQEVHFDTLLLTP